MKTLPDDTLLAFADGELSPEARTQVARDLVQNDEARRSVYMFRVSRLYVERLYDDALSTLILPPRLLGRAAANGSVPVTKAGHYQTWATIPVGAASLMIGMVCGYLLHIAVISDVTRAEARTSQTMLGRIPTGTPIADALSFDAARGGTWLTNDGGKIITTDRFRDQFGNRCRELQVFTPPGGQVPAEIVVACRMRRGEWAAVAAVATRSKGQNIEAVYAPTGTEVRTAVDGVLAMIGAERAQKPNSNESTTQ